MAKRPSKEDLLQEARQSRALAEKARRLAASLVTEHDRDSLLRQAQALDDEAEKFERLAAKM